MNKKQRNRKLVTQNKRNRIINRRYTSTIKTLSKLFLGKLKTIDKNVDLEGEKKIQRNNEFLKIIGTIYSFIDKAVKKKVLHKNTAARKKSKIRKLFDYFFFS